MVISNICSAVDDQNEKLQQSQAVLEQSVLQKCSVKSSQKANIGLLG